MREPNVLIWDSRLAESEKERVSEVNASLEVLNCLRAVEINVSGIFAQSKIAWKLATYEHVILHRIVALADGVAVGWNNRTTLSAILSARALMESIALMAAFEKRVARLLKSEDLKELNALADCGLFASRDSEWLSMFPDTQATNISTHIDNFERQLPGFKEHYERLSERCHPNSLGHKFMFSKTDRTTGTVHFFDESEPEANGRLVLAALVPLLLVKSLVVRLDTSIIGVSQLQHRIFPVGGEAKA